MKPIIAAIVFLLSSTISVFSADFYVSTAGSDSNPGTPAQPFATIQHAIDACPYGVYSSIVHLDGSTWNESPTLEATNYYFPPSPPPDRPNLTVVGDYNGPNGMGGQDNSVINGCFTMEALFEGQMQSTATLSCATTKQVIAIAATTFPGSVGCGNIHITSCNVINSTSHGIICQSDGWNGFFIISGCNISGSTEDGIQILNMSPYFMLNLNSSNINENLGSGILINNTAVTTNSVNINNNSISGNNDKGIVFTNSKACLYDNDIIDNIDYGIYITGDNSNPDLGGGTLGSIGNNTISGNGTYEVYNASPNNIYAKYNHWDSQSEGEMAGGYYNTVNVTRIWDKWEDTGKGYIMWSDPNPTKTAAPSLGMLKATFYPSSNTVGKAKKR